MRFHFKYAIKGVFLRLKQKMDSLLFVIKENSRLKWQTVLHNVY